MAVAKVGNYDRVVRRQAIRLATRASQPVTGSTRIRGAQEAATAECPRLNAALLEGATQHPLPASAELRALGRSLKGESGALVERITGMIRELPDYRGVGDASLWTEIQQIVRMNVELFYSVVIDGRLATEEEVIAARYFARRRANQGIALRGHLNAYRNGLWMLWGELVSRVMDRPRLQKELLLRAAWAFRHLETMTSAVAASYTSELEGRVRHRDRTVRDLVDEILGGGGSVSEELSQRAVTIGLDLRREFRTIVMRPAQSFAADAPLPSAAIAVTVAEAASLSVDEVTAVERQGELLLLVPACAEQTPESLERLVRAKLVGIIPPKGAEPGSIVVGVSGPVSGVEGLRQGYREALRAIEIGHLFAGVDFLFFYENYILHDVLAEGGGRAGRRLVESALGSLLERGETGRRLIETLEAYYRAGCNLKVAAGALDVHPNTLAYRLRQVHDIAGFDPASPEYRLRTEIALRLLELHKRRGQSAGATPRRRTPSDAGSCSDGGRGDSRHVEGFDIPVSNASNSRSLTRAGAGRP